MDIMWLRYGAKLSRSTSIHTYIHQFYFRHNGSYKQALRNKSSKQHARQAKRIKNKNKT